MHLLSAICYLLVGYFILGYIYIWIKEEEDKLKKMAEDADAEKLLELLKVEFDQLLTLKHKQRKYEVNINS